MVMRQTHEPSLPLSSEIHPHPHPHPNLFPINARNSVVVARTSVHHSATIEATIYRQGQSLPRKPLEVGSNPPPDLVIWGMAAHPAQQYTHRDLAACPLKFMEASFRPLVGLTTQVEVYQEQVRLFRQSLPEQSVKVLSLGRVKLQLV